MATGYSVFANGGYRINPMIVTRVTDTRGKTLVEVATPPLSESARGIEARNAFVMTSLMQEVTRTGTAARAQAALKRADVFGKTGTTNDSMDAWFAGYHNSLVAVVWIGYDTPRKLGDKETGGGLALPIWIDYMGYALKGVPVADISAPPGLVNSAGEWYFQEYAYGRGIPSVGLDAPPVKPMDPEERQSILDLFRTE
jgi:penicillin-binding protein 1A